MLSVSLRTLSIESEAIFALFWQKEIARNLSRTLLAHVLKKSEVWVASNDPLLVPDIQVRSIRRLLKRAAQGEPLAHLLGTAMFYEKPFSVTPATLIPRPETEGLVDLILKQWPASEKRAFAIDIGTGSGCIGITLALKRSPLNVVLTDVSRRALRVAKKNAITHLGSHAKEFSLIQASLFGRTVQDLIKTKKIDHLFIAANLPYLPDSDRKKLSKSVTKFEPHKALFGGTCGEELILKLLNQIRRFSKTHPEMRLDVVLEFDPPQAKKLEKVAQALFPKAEVAIEKDGFERERFLCVRL